MSSNERASGEFGFTSLVFLPLLVLLVDAVLTSFLACLRSFFPAQSQLQGQIQADIAQALTNHVAKPFEGWANAHSARIKESRRTILDGWVNSWENQVGEVDKVSPSSLLDGSEGEGDGREKES